MKVLTIKQPWAGLIISGHKGIENRSWSPGKRLNIDDELLIHSSVAIDKDAFELDHVWEIVEDDKSGLYTALGRIIGKVIYKGCVSSELDPRVQKYDPQQLWYYGDKGWLLSNPVEADEPKTEIKGRLGVWNYQGVGNGS